MANVQPSDVIHGVVLVEPESHGDSRGRFVESYRRSWFPAASEMVQANRSDKQAGAVVGLHFHLRQSDYWYAPVGRVLVGLHDLREGSPTDGATLVFEIGERHERGVYIPPGVAHGFSSLTDVTLTYLVDQYYDPDDELGIAWDDPDAGIDWQVGTPVLSKRDQTNPLRRDLPADLRPSFAAAG